MKPKRGLTTARDEPTEDASRNEAEPQTEAAMEASMAREDWGRSLKSQENRMENDELGRDQSEKPANKTESKQPDNKFRDRN